MKSMIGLWCYFAAFSDIFTKTSDKDETSSLCHKRFKSHFQIERTIFWFALQREYLNFFKFFKLLQNVFIAGSHKSFIRAFESFCLYNYVTCSRSEKNLGKSLLFSLLTPNGLEEYLLINYFDELVFYFQNKFFKISKVQKKNLPIIDISLVCPVRFDFVDEVVTFRGCYKSSFLFICLSFFRKWHWF